MEQLVRKTPLILTLRASQRQPTTLRTSQITAMVMTLLVVLNAQSFPHELAWLSRMTMMK